MGIGVFIENYSHFLSDHIYIYIDPDFPFFVVPLSFSALLDWSALDSFSSSSSDSDSETVGSGARVRIPFPTLLKFTSAVGSCRSGSGQWEDQRGLVKLEKHPTSRQGGLDIILAFDLFIFTQILIAFFINNIELVQFLVVAIFP